jgi:predicted transcriptional regulator
MTSESCKVLQKDRELDVGVAAAAEELGVTSQTVRNQVRAGLLAGRKDDRGRWRVEASSVQASLDTHGRGAHGDATASLRSDVRRLATALEELRANWTLASDGADMLRGERDRYRAEAAAARSAAVSLIAAAREVEGAVKQTLKILDLQADALVQLLAPGSPEDLRS